MIPPHAGAERIACKPYAATLTARSCVLRRHAALHPEPLRFGSMTGPTIVLASTLACRTCPDGAALAARFT